MRMKVALLIAVGLILILVSSGLMLSHLRDADRRIAEADQKVAAFGTLARLPTVKRSIARGEVIEIEDFADVEVPASYVPQGVLTALPPFTAANQQYFALTDLKAGRLLTPADIAASGDTPAGIFYAAGQGAAVLDPRNLAEMLPLLKVGDQVDVYWSHDIGGGSTETRRVAANLRVIGLPGAPPALPAAGTPEDQTAGHPARPGPNPLADKFVVAAGPEALPALVQARARGDIYISLSGMATTSANGEIVVDDRVLGAMPLVTRTAEPTATLANAVTKASGPQMCNLSVVRSAERTVIQVPCE